MLQRRLLIQNELLLYGKEHDSIVGRGGIDRLNVQSPRKGPSSCIKEETVAMNTFVDEDEEDKPGCDVTTSMGPQTAQAWANVQDRR